MAWDNIISRMSWLFLQPSNLLVILLLISVLGVFFINPNHKRYRTFVKLNIFVVVIMSAISFTNLASWIMWPLEARFSEYKELSLDENYSGIIVLAGSERTIISSYVNQATFSNAGERIYQTVAVAKKYFRLTHNSYWRD
jgi:c-di-AMP phosphodiesterase-like protein